MKNMTVKLGKLNRYKSIRLGKSILIIFTISLITSCGYTSTRKSKEVKTMDLKIADIDENKSPITYIELLKYVIENFSEDNLLENDPVLGKLQKFYPKNIKNDISKKDKASYQNINYNSSLTVHLTKDKNTSLWSYLSLYYIFGPIDNLIPIKEEDFKNILGLTEQEIRYEKEYGTYKYIYLYKDKIKVEFVVKEKDFNHEKYPKNYIMINMRRLN